MNNQLHNKEAYNCPLYAYITHSDLKKQNKTVSGLIPWKRYENVARCAERLRPGVCVLGWSVCQEQHNECTSSADLFCILPQEIRCLAGDLQRGSLNPPLLFLYRVRPFL